MRAERHLPRRSRRRPLLAALTCCVVGCGGQAQSAPATPATAAQATPPPAVAEAAPPPSAAPAASPAAPAEEDPEKIAYDEPGADPANLTPLFGKGSPPAFPPATVSEHECWQTVSPSGTARKDYDAIIAKCGAATGSVEYVKPAVGKLHSKHDKRDTFVVPIYGGYCYRFFGVADSTIRDLDVLIEKKGGALVGDDKTVGPVAIIESDKAWCLDRDGTYDFLVEVDGEGHGSYVFGVWVRKK